MHKMADIRRLGFSNPVALYKLDANTAAKAL
jgi:hypothetical protein